MRNTSTCALGALALGLILTPGNCRANDVFTSFEFIDRSDDFTHYGDESSRGGNGLDDPIPEPIPQRGMPIFFETVVSGLTAPLWGTHAPGLPGTLFVVDQPGIVWAIDLETSLPSIFLDVSDRLVDLGVFGEGTFDERGLLGLAFDPDYASNGLLYTYTSQPVDGEADFSTMPDGIAANHHSVITEFRADDPGNPRAMVDPGTARVLLRFDEPQFNHNAGSLATGPDGMLYIALGDGGGADDRDGQDFLGTPIVGHGLSGNGQDAGNPFGAILRIDPSGSNSANGQYGIPDDNPFAGSETNVQEIFAYGFRNPFRMSFDMATGDLYVGDVGQNDIEEIDIVVSGGNYGWNAKEGSFFFDPNGNEAGFVTDEDPGVPPGLIDPIAEYDHDEGIAIIGGFVYRGRDIPSLRGRYIFGDWSRNFLTNDGRLFFLNPHDNIVEFRLGDRDTLGLAVHGFAQDAEGEVYLLGNSTGVPFGDTGVVLRLSAPSSRRGPGSPQGDLNGDGLVNIRDLVVLLGQLGECDGCDADLDGNGVVDSLDLMAMLRLVQ